MIEDIYKGGEQEISEVVEVEILIMQVGKQHNQVRRSPIKIIGFSFMPF